MDVISLISQSIKVKEQIMQDKETIDSIYNIINKIIYCLGNGNKIMLLGNGGSAADAQHIAAEFVGRFKKERKALPAIALTTDTSVITSISNDYCYDHIFERQIEAIANRGDMIIGISTSGDSPNVVNALICGKKIGTINIALLGKNGGVAKKYADTYIIVPSNDTARIQEMHIMLGHIICEIVENKIIYGE